MRMSAASITKNLHWLLDKPKEGTRLRQLYDRALDHEPFTAHDLYPAGEQWAISRLREEYEMNIQVVARKKGDLPTVYVLE